MASSTCSSSAGTLKVPVNVDIEKDCAELKAAVTESGIDVKPFVLILGHRTLTQRLEIRKVYTEQYKTDLLDEIKRVKGKKLRNLLLLLLKDHAAIKAEALYQALDRFMPDEDVVIELLCKASNPEISAIKLAYEVVLGRSLEDDIKTKMSGNLQKLLLRLVSYGCNKDGMEEMTDEMLKRQANNLRHAEVSWRGVDPEPYIHVLTTTSSKNMSKLRFKFTQLTRTMLETHIKQTFHGNFGKALLLTYQHISGHTIIDNSEVFMEALLGLMVDHEKLMRNIVLTCENELANICDTFYQRMDKELFRYIKENTKGDYQDLLLALVDG